MEFLADYAYAMTAEEIQKCWPKLKEKENFHFTSRKTKLYNCVAWAMGLSNLHICMYYFKEVHELDRNNLDHSVDGYATILKDYYGFDICEDGSLENDFEKIALYGTSDRGFEHATRQVENGNWTSKIGTYEDIEHYSVDALAGDSYGTPLIFMKRKKG